MGLEAIIPKLEKVTVGLLWCIWEDLLESGEKIDVLCGHMEELEAAYVAGDKQHFKEIVMKALKENSDG